MGGSELVIELPPPGTLIRDLTVTAVNMMEKFGGVKINVDREEGKVKVKVFHPDLESALRSFSNELINIHEVKGKVTRWPRLHTNDKGTLKNVIPQEKLETLGDYGDVARYYVERLPELLGKGGTLKVILEGGSIVKKKRKLKYDILIRLSREGREYPGDIAMLQLFKVELYEDGLVFRQPYNFHVGVRLDESWASLLLSGFILSYTGATADGTISLMSIPELSYDPCHRDSWLTINLANTLRRMPTSPTIPYILYTYIVSILLENPNSRKALLAEVPEGLELLNRIVSEKCRVRWDEGISLRIHRISYGRIPTEVSREDLIIGGGIAKLANLCTEEGCECLQQIGALIERGSKTINTKILNAIAILYEALIGSKNPAEASYYVVRTLRDLEEGVLVSRYCIEKLLEVLTGIKTSSREQAVRG